MLLLEILDEPIEFCTEDSCMFSAYKSFKNRIVTEIFNKMYEDYDNVFRLDTKKNKVKVKVDWYSNNFNDDLWEYNIDKIKYSIVDAFITCGIISRKDKLFSSNYLEIINIDKVPFSKDDSDIKTDRVIIKIVFEL
jgi:hypothetical protein